MKLTSEILETAIEELSKLPGTGKKSAQRIALHLVKKSASDVQRLAEAMIALKTKIKHCSRCFTLTDSDICPICESEKRNTGELCIVEEPQDVIMIERTSTFKGRYHVLGGSISPMDNIGPDQLRIKELLQRIHSKDEQITEIILALNPDSEGEATSFYLNKLLGPFELNITRIAYGVPMGTHLEYIDEATISRALANRSHF
jgi:recombination protein RecR